MPRPSREFKSSYLMYYSLLCFCFEIATFATLPALRPPFFSFRFSRALHVLLRARTDGASRRRRTGAKQRYGTIRRSAVGPERLEGTGGIKVQPVLGLSGWNGFFLLNRWIFQKKKSCNHQKMMMMMMMNFRSAQLPNHQKIYTSHKKHNTYKKCSNSLLA